MSKRLGYVAALTAAALAIGAALIFIGGEGAQDSRAQPDAADPNALAALGGDQTPRDLNRLAQSEIIGPGGGGGGYLRFESPGRRTTLRYDRLDPAGPFTYQTTQPSAVIANPDATRVITIAADSGRFVAPNNQLDRGQFDGEVTLAIYESNGRPVQLDNDTPRLRVHLIGATFDAQLGTIESDGQVFVTAPDFEFRGRELSMVYSDLRQRLSRLEVAYGESLTFNANTLNPNAPIPSPATPDSLLAPAATPSADPSTDSSKPDRASTPPTRATAEPEPAPRETNRRARDQPTPEEQPALYTAVFERDIQLVASEATIDADILAVTFALDAIQTNDPDPQPKYPPTPTPTPKPNPQAGAERSAAPGTPNPTAPPTPTANTPSTPDEPDKPKPTPQPTTTTATTTTTTTTTTPADPRSLFRPTPDDATITWTGPLVVEPAARTPEAFAGRDDAFIRLDGTPVRIRTAKGESVAAPAVTYLRSAGRVTADGSVALPARVTAADGATLIGRSLDLAANTGRGSIQGPGTLTTAPQPNTPQHTAPQAEAERSAASGTPLISIPTPAPTPTSINFQDSLDLTFVATNNNPQSATTPVAALGPLRVADFRGPVRVDDPRLTLTAQRRLTARFFDDTPSPRLATLDAEGSVAIAATPNAPAEPLKPGSLAPPPNMVTLDADQLTVGFALDPTGREQPVRIAAARDVVAQSLELKLTADRLDIDLTSPTTHPTPQTQAGAEQSAAPGTPNQTTTTTTNNNTTPNNLDRIANLTADGGITLDLFDQGLTLAGDRLVVDATNDQAELFGSPIDSDDWATATQTPDRGGAQLAGAHLVFRQADGSARVPGPGRLTTPLNPAENDTATQTDPLTTVDNFDTLAATPDAPPSELAVDWQRGMTFYNNAGQARFTGNVVATTVQDNATSRLTADDLRLAFTPLEGNPTDSAQRRLISAAAAGPLAATPDDRPAFTHVTRDPATDALLTRLTLTGERMDLDNAGPAPVLDVPSDGYVLIEDHRPNPTPPNTPTQAGAEQSAAPGTNHSNNTNNTNSNPNPLATFSGRGDTLMLFNRALRLTDGPNTLDAVGDIELIHQPASRSDRDDPQAQQPSQLNAQRLVVDLADSADLGPMFAADANASTDAADTPRTLDIQQINAHGAVRILDGTRRVLTDHLRYSAADNTAWLWSDAGRTTRINDQSYPTGLGMQAILWDLNRDRIDIRRPGPGLIAIPAETPNAQPPIALPQNPLRDQIEHRSEPSHRMPTQRQRADPEEQ